MLVRHKFLQLADSSTGIHDILRIALLVRLAVWMTMCLSCQVLPNHNPGDDVLRFDLFLNNTNNSSGDDLFSFDDCSYSFQSLLQTDFLRSTSNQEKAECAATSLHRLGPVLQVLQARIFPFLLLPLTRWDAARFLRLAHDPGLRYRPSCQPLLLDDDTTLCPNPYWEAEQAHAFLPFFPLAIRITATTLWHIIPRLWLPASCQALLVLAGVLLNVTCFMVATWDLYYMTLQLLLYHQHVQQKKTDDDDNIWTVEFCHKWAQRTTLVFVFNPANVFFGTVYSESLAAFLLFRGCQSAVNMLVTDWNRWSEKSNSSNSAMRGFFAMISCSFFWFLAAWTRSNANLYAGFLLLYGMGMCMRQDTKYWERLLFLSWSILLVVGLVTGSVGLYNYLAVQSLCQDTSMGEAGPSGMRPAWCDRNEPFFNLYGYVQDNYWNVGFLRYYQWKQIPNFLLAAPILSLSTAAVIVWIQSSWFYFRKYYRDEGATNGLLIAKYIKRFIHWAIQSLRTFAGGGGVAMQSSSPKDSLTGSLLLLGFYAVLGASTILGLTVAHVQISTRLLCSSCPALYWFCAVMIQNNPRRIGDATILYFALYIFLGCFLHPIWFPWT